MVRLRENIAVEEMRGDVVATPSTVGPVGTSVLEVEILESVSWLISDPAFALVTTIGAGAGAPDTLGLGSGAAADVVVACGEPVESVVVACPELVEVADV
jgi:hypothetical protein